LYEKIKFIATFYFFLNTFHYLGFRQNFFSAWKVSSISNATNFCNYLGVPIFRQKIIILLAVKIKKSPHSTATQDFFMKAGGKRIFYGEKGAHLSSY